MTVKLDHQIDRLGDQTHAVFAGDGLAFTVGYGRLPAACPYAPGDWVRMHAFPQSGRPASDPDQHGWRGFVIGGMGGTLLRGLTDDGRDWYEHYGHLARDGQPGSNIVECACCPPRSRRRETERETRTGQYALFDLAVTR